LTVCTTVKVSVTVQLPVPAQRTVVDATAPAAWIVVTLATPVVELGGPPEPEEEPRELELEPDGADPPELPDPPEPPEPPEPAPALVVEAVTTLVGADEAGALGAPLLAVSSTTMVCPTSVACRV
jgi:hypothetical protein